MSPIVHTTEDKENLENAVLFEFTPKRPSRTRTSVKSLFDSREEPLPPQQAEITCEPDELPTVPTTPNGSFEEELFQITNRDTPTGSLDSNKKRRRNLFVGSLRKKLKNI